MSRIATTFQNLKRQGKKALIPYITAGDPQLATTLHLMRLLVEEGADLIEIGVPFSDPMADGPVIQRANERALKHGIGLANVLEMLEEFRSNNAHTPVVLMGYANPIEAMGVHQFAERAARAGVDGVITVDYPPEESSDYLTVLRQQEIDSIFLLSPTTTLCRAEIILQEARGFVYYVSRTGVTGAAHLDLIDVASRVAAIRRLTALPIGVGFGIGDANTAKAAAEIADAVVIGSRLVQVVAEATTIDNLSHSVRAFMQNIRVAVDSVTKLRSGHELAE